MKRFFVNILMSIFTLSFFVGCQKKGMEVSDKERDQKIIATFVLGKVAKKTQVGNWDIVKVGDILDPNQVIRLAEKSRLTLQTETGSVITLSDESEIVISSIINPSTGDEKTEVNLSEGKAVVNPRDIKGLPNSSFSVRTPAMVAGVRGTVFSIEHSKGESKVMVKEGKVVVKPAIKSEVQEKLEIEVKEGQKSSIDKNTVKEIEKKVAENKIEDIKLQDKVEAITEEENKKLEEDVKSIVKFDLKVDTEKEQVVKKNTYSLTVIALGSDIYINDEMKGSEYMSALYPEGKIKIEIKKDGNVLLSKEIELNSDITVDYTPIDNFKKDVNETIEKKELTPLYSIKLGNSKLFISGDYSIGVSGTKVVFTDNQKVLKEVYCNPKVTPLITEKAVFVYDGGISVYSSTGELLNKVKIGTILFPTDFGFHNGVAYIYDSIGNVLGIDEKGNKVFEEKIRGTITGIGVNNGYVSIATVSGIYLVKDGKIVSNFEISGTKIINKVGILGNKNKFYIVVPQDNNIVTIRDLSGNIIGKISAVPADVEPVADDIFSLVYSNKAVLYNLNGEKIKEVTFSPGNFVIGNGAIYTWDKNKVYEYRVNFENRKELPEEINSVSVYGDKIVVYTKKFNVYNLNF